MQQLPENFCVAARDLLRVYSEYVLLEAETRAMIEAKEAELVAARQRALHLYKMENPQHVGTFEHSGE